MKRLMSAVALVLAFAIGVSLGPSLRRDVEAQPITSVPGVAELSAPAGWGRAIGYGIGPGGGTVLFEAADGTLRQWVIAVGATTHVIRRN